MQQGETFVEDTDTQVDDFRHYWFGRGGVSWLAEEHGAVLGAYTLRPNHVGRGSHIATATYMVADSARGRGLGRQLGEHSIAEARRLGFQGIQFNFVVSTNEAAVKLWQSLGFTIVGRLPGVFRHPRLGMVDAFVMFLTL